MTQNSNIPGSEAATAKQTVLLNKSIRRWDLVLLVVNSIIGAGIFGLPSKIFALSGVYSLLAFAVCAVVIMIFILCFAEVASQFDQTGGPYAYILKAFGRFPAFIMGWLLILSRIFNYAALINLLIIYFSYFSETFNQPAIRVACIVLISASLGYINHVGVKNSTQVSNIITIAKLLPLTAFIIIGLFSMDSELFTNNAPIQLSSFTTSILLLVFAFGGFESILANSGEIEKPQKNIPFALIAAAIFVAVYYCLIQLVSIGTLPGLAASEKPLADAADNFMGSYGGSIMAIGALVSITGTLNVLMLSGSRLPFALSMEKQLPPFLSFVHAKYRTPTWSLLVMFLIVTIVSIAWSFFAALTIASIIRILVYLMVCASLIRLRRQKKTDIPYFKIRNGYFFAISGIALSIWLLAASKWSEVIAVSACIVAGIVLFMISKRSRKSISGSAIKYR